MFNFNKGENMQRNEAGRTMIEILGVLAIAAILSIGGIWAFQLFMRQQTVNSILNTLTLETVNINSAMQGTSFKNSEELNQFLSKYKAQVAGYQLSFYASPDGDGFVSEITSVDGNPIKGQICRDLITKMAKQQFISDVDFTLKDEEKEDGTTDDITVRLNGRYVDLNAVCGG